MYHPIEENNATVYQAPMLYVAIFYAVLAAWTVIFVPLIIKKFMDAQISTLLFLVTVGLFGFSWYWSLGIFYKAVSDADGTMRLVALRRSIHLNFRDIFMVEGPPAPMFLGFIRFGLENEKAYMFFYKKKSLTMILRAIQASNPDIQFKLSAL
jgi:hypothetical protein